MLKQKATPARAGSASAPRAGRWQKAWGDRMFDLFAATSDSVLRAGVTLCPEPASNRRDQTVRGDRPVPAGRLGG